MLKKIILWSLFGGLVVILLVGAVNRTMAKSGDEALLGGQGAGRGQAAGVEHEADEYELAAPAVQGQGRSAGGGLGDGSGVESGVREQNWGQYAENDGIPDAAQYAEELVTLEGAIDFVDAAGMTIRTGAGEIEIGGQAWRYILEQGFAFQAGELVRLHGFYETPDHFEPVMVENLSQDRQIQLRELNGRPLWAGGGRRGQ